MLGSKAESQETESTKGAKPTRSDYRIMEHTWTPFGKLYILGEGPECYSAHDRDDHNDVFPPNSIVLDLTLLDIVYYQLFNLATDERYDHRTSRRSFELNAPVNLESALFSPEARQMTHELWRSNVAELVRILHRAERRAEYYATS